MFSGMDQKLCAGKDQLLNQSYNMKMRELLAIAIYNILMYTRSNTTDTAIPSLLKRRTHLTKTATTVQLNKTNNGIAWTQNRENVKSGNRSLFKTAAILKRLI